MALSATGCPEGDPDCGTFIVVLRAILTGIDGVGQVGGLAAMAEALFLPTAGPLGRATAETTASKPEHAGVRLRPVPWLDEDALGLGVVGSF
jgi:hypothetical protein